MAELSLADLFPGATQTSTEIRIPKSALPTLTPLADNKTEVLVAAIAIRLSQVFTEAAREADLDRSIVAATGIPRSATTFDANNQAQNFLVRQVAIELYEPLVLADWDADVY